MGNQAFNFGGNSGNLGGGLGGWADDGSVVRLKAASDYVGIGTTAPGEKLTVAGNISAQGGLSAHSAFLSGSVNLPDDAKIQLGNGNDLEIYHDGGTSIIKDNGTGG